MKKTILAFLILSFIFSCKKEKEIGDVSFSTSFARVQDSVSYDSVSYIIMNYSLTNEFNDNSSFDDSSKYSHSIKLDVDKNQRINGHFGTKYIHLDKGQYVIKRFDLVDKYGKVIYCIPYEIPENYKTNVINNLISLPILFSTPEANTSFVFTIIKK